MPKLTQHLTTILRMAAKHSDGLYFPGGLWSTPWERANHRRGAAKLVTIGLLEPDLTGGFRITEAGRIAAAN